MTLVAMVMPALLALIQFAGLGVPIAIPYILLFLGVGVSLLVHNIEARRAHLLHGVLPWVGIVSGAFFVFIGIRRWFCSRPRSCFSGHSA